MIAASPSLFRVWRFRASSAHPKEAESDSFLAFAAKTKARLAAACTRPCTPSLSFIQYATDVKNLIIKNLCMRFLGKNKNVTYLYWKWCGTHPVLHKSSLARNKRFLTPVAYCIHSSVVVSRMLQEMLCYSDRIKTLTNIRRNTWFPDRTQVRIFAPNKSIVSIQKCPSLIPGPSSGQLPKISGIAVAVYHNKVTNQWRINNEWQKHHI